jgi:PIN domain nuclease of toxin-antitoxin system
MRLLIDTHTFLWFVEGDPQLSAEARRLLEDADNEIWLSLASVWEMAIKFSIGKLTLLDRVRPFAEHLSDLIESNGIAILPVTLPQVLHVATLPLHHRDPFDRLLVAQSLTEGMPLVSADAVLDAYRVRRLW